MSRNLPEYCAVIRTIGKAGDKYQKLLDSLKSQTHPPKSIIVYLAYGYEKPSETINFEQIVYVKKGMVSQRALKYNEVDTEWMLCLDDDLSLEPWSMEKIFLDTLQSKADVCSIDAIPHHLIPFKTRLVMALLLTSIPRIGNNRRGYRINFLGTDCYNPNPKYDWAWSTTNAGAAFICRKKDFLNLHLEEELWMDSVPIAAFDDRVMFYKMHIKGLKVITHYSSGFTHLDAGTSNELSFGVERMKRAQYSSAFTSYIFEELYLKPNLSIFHKILRVPLKIYMLFVLYFYSLYKRYKGQDFPEERRKGRAKAKEFIKKFKE